MIELHNEQLTSAFDSTSTSTETAEMMIKSCEKVYVKSKGVSGNASAVVLEILVSGMTEDGTAFEFHSLETPVTLAGDGYVIADLSQFAFMKVACTTAQQGSSIDVLVNTYSST